MASILIFFALLFFNACYINERGISNRFYDDCSYYYDASGTYREKCPKNWIDIPYFKP
ncbi:hypothetical protein [uncultured Campylobacter sp.]|uniref:hypothetical protein n=1 Tax=uncultured Campylobacter sp. TaxID=218934 RepID=UPI0026363082|nr:hypothetical protein [uncultured Campylobacter sp.]